MASFAPAAEPESELGRYRILSPSCGLRVSPLCLGAGSLGEAWTGLLGSMTKEASFKLLDTFYEKGGNFIDTANHYQEGESELIIGEWLAKNKNRDEMVIATKFTSGYAGTNAKIKVNHQGNHYKSMFMSVRDSLKKTTYIDILYVHWWDYTTSIEEMMQGLNNLVKSGQVLYLGVSDTPAWIVSEANRYAKSHGLAPFVIYQGRWNVADPDFEREILPMARAHGMALAPWNAMGGGKFQSKKALEERKKNGEALRPMTGPEQSENEVKMSEGLTKVAEELGTESVTAVALAYLLQKTPYVFPIVGGRKVEHLLANIEALSFELSPEQTTALESAIPFDLGFPQNMIGSDPHLNGEKVNFIMNQGKYRFVQGETAIKPLPKK